MKEKCYKDNLIIVLSVILVLVVICGCVAGVVFGLSNNDIQGKSVAQAYVNQDNNVPYPIELQSLTFTLSEPIIFDLVADSSITNLSVSFYSVFDDFITLYNQTYDTNYTTTISSGRGDFDRFVPYAFVIQPYSMEYTAITSSTDFRFTLKQYNQPLTNTTSTFDIRVANNSYLYSSSTLTCYGAKLSIPIEWNTTYPGAGVLGKLKITKLTVYYIEPESLYFYGYDNGEDIGFDNGYQLGYDDGTGEGYENGFTAGRFEGRYEGYEIGKEEGYTEGYDIGYNTGRQTGYYEGIESAGDYSWYSLISAVFDAPLKIMIGDWKEVDGEWQLVGGMLNFTIPGLDINFAPVLTSLFTLVILIVLLRFIFSFIG